MYKTEAQKRAACFDTLRMVEIMSKPHVAGLLADAGGDARLVGRWIWVEFTQKPGERVRRVLKCLGFRWNRKRSAWQHSCGVRSVHSPGDPRFKYGAVPVSALTDRADDERVVA